MFKIYADSDLIYDSRIEDYVLTKGQVTKEANKAGKFVFSIEQDNPYFDNIIKLKTVIKVYRDNELVFRGRALYNDISFNNERTITCEGELAFLNDSIIRPYEFSGSPKELFTKLIEEHNSAVDASKRFIIGDITVEDKNDYIARANSEYANCLENLNDKLVNSLGGYLDIQPSSNGATISWLQDYPYYGNQSITFGENLRDFARTDSAEEIATAIIPLGYADDESGEKLTIKDINNGNDYVYDATAVQMYGWIFKTVEWEDVTLATNLKTKAEAYLNESINQNITIEVSAIDLSYLDNTLDSFKLGDYVNVKSEPHDIDSMMLIKNQEIDILNPANDKITLGYAYKSFTDQLKGKNGNTTLVKRIEMVEANYDDDIASIRESIETLSSTIDQTSRAITMEVAATYTTNEQLTESISTLYEQTKDEFSFTFENTRLDIEANEETNRKKFETIEKYIRFVDGNIILGNSESNLTLKIENDELAFYQESQKVAYFSNNRLIINDTNSQLQLGNFAFFPRSNGSLDFRKVV